MEGGRAPPGRVPQGRWKLSTGKGEELHREGGRAPQGKGKSSIRYGKSFPGKWKSSLKPILNWANVCSPEHTSDPLTNYDSFLN